MRKIGEYLIIIGIVGFGFITYESAPSPFKNQIDLLYGCFCLIIIGAFLKFISKKQQ